MIDTEKTKMLCGLLALSDGRSDDMKKILIKAIRHSISTKDARIAVRMAITADWRRDALRYRGYEFDIHTLDYDFIVTRFWKQWRRLSKNYDQTYVRYWHWQGVNTSRNYERWTYMYIYVADSLDRLRRWEHGMGANATRSPLFIFEEDKNLVLNWIRKWSTIESSDAKITVKVIGEYGNLCCGSRMSFFEYELARR